jgi:tetratricopeptide (TPR) repeat protein
MNASQRVHRIALVVLLLSMAGSMVVLHAVDGIRRGATLQETLYIRSATALRRLSLGYTGLLADIYWTRAVQYFGERHFMAAKDYALLYPLLDITTQLDPKLTVVYQFGANFLSPPPPLGAGEPAKAIDLLQYGIRNNPDDWKLYYGLGFVYYLELKDYAKAADAFERGSHVPHAHPFLRILAARMAQHAGEFDTARILWVTTYQSTQDEKIRQNAVWHLQALQVDQDVTNLEAVVARYRQQTGRLPASMLDLEHDRFLRGIPLDPTGHPYKLMPDGRIEIDDPQSIPFITKGLPPGMESPQPQSTEKN